MPSFRCSEKCKNPSKRFHIHIVFSILNNIPLILNNKKKKKMTGPKKYT